MVKKCCQVLGERSHIKQFLNRLHNTGDFCLLLIMTAQAVEERRLLNRDVTTWYIYSRSSSFGRESRKSELLFTHLLFSSVIHSISEGGKIGLPLQ
jgi:F0F1-type ATP synthase beta subunit